MCNILVVVILISCSYSNPWECAIILTVPLLFIFALELSDFNESAPKLNEEHYKTHTQLYGYFVGCVI